MHEENSFITLTYSDENCPERLDYSHIQKFLKKLRKVTNGKINYFCTGEYGDKKKRPHWHIIIFGWRPRDADYFRSNDRGDRIYTSKTLDKLWGQGHTELGSVTIESANYCARYAAKKLSHGKDGTHMYEPISRKSSHSAIGKRWLERYYQDVFNHGYVEFQGKQLPIPRYYVKWLKKHLPEEWKKYVTTLKLDKARYAEEMATAEATEYIKSLRKRGPFKTTPRTRNQVRAQIKQAKFKQLQEKLKL